MNVRRLSADHFMPRTTASSAVAVVSHGSALDQNRVSERTLPGVPNRGELRIGVLRSASQPPRAGIDALRTITLRRARRQVYDCHQFSDDRAMGRCSRSRAPSPNHNAIGGQVSRLCDRLSKAGFATGVLLDDGFFSKALVIIASSECVELEPCVIRRALGPCLLRT